MYGREREKMKEKTEREKGEVGGAKLQGAFTRYV